MTVGPPVLKLACAGKLTEGGSAPWAPGGYTRSPAARKSRRSSICRGAGGVKAEFRNSGRGCGREAAVPPDELHQTAGGDDFHDGGSQGRQRHTCGSRQILADRP